MPTTLQDIISSAASKLGEAFERFKASKKARKELEKQLENRLQEDPDYLNLLQEEKNLKKKRREISETLKDLKDQKNLMMRNLEEYEEVEEFVEKTEGAFLTRRDEVLEILSKDLSAKGIEAELKFKSGDLMLVVSRQR